MVRGMLLHGFMPSALAAFAITAKKEITGKTERKNRVIIHQD
jgi:hypothetical protein